MRWLAEHAQHLIYINLGWYVLLAVAFGVGGDFGRALYFGGAAVLTVGVIAMK